MVEILQNKNNTDKTEYIATERGKVLGRIAGEFAGDLETFVINELDCEEPFADGLIRAILNLLALHGVDKARFDLPEHIELLRKLRFIGDKPEIESINAFFAGGCGGHN